MPAFDCSGPRPLGFVFGPMTECFASLVAAAFDGDRTADILTFVADLASYNYLVEFLGIVAGTAVNSDQEEAERQNYHHIVAPGILD